MQKILTMALFQARKKNNLTGLLNQLKAYSDVVEVIYHPYEGGADKKNFPNFLGLELNNYNKFTTLSLSLAAGNYFLCTDADFLLDETNFKTFLDYLKKSRNDVLVFERKKLSTLCAVRTIFAKKLIIDDGTLDVNTYLSGAMILNRNCEKVAYSPFKLIKGDNLLTLCDDFKKYKVSIAKLCKLFSSDKAKLSSNSYKVAYDMLVDMALKRYICTIYLVLKKKEEQIEIEAFDIDLKDTTPFIYFGAEKKFDLGNLTNLRKDKFEKIPLLTKFLITNAVNNS
jgi:hypothetical protein